MVYIPEHTLFSDRLTQPLRNFCGASVAVGDDSPGDAAVASQLVVFSVVFGLLGAIEAWLLVVGGRRMLPGPVGWQRRGWWAP